MAVAHRYDVSPKVFWLGKLSHKGIHPVAHFGLLSVDPGTSE
jgi:hypothetical protein